jgi:endoglucanase
MIKKILLVSALTVHLVTIQANGQGFLKVSDKQIVNGRGEKVILRGMGLGGWMLQEGYMLRVQKIGNQQHKIREEILDLVGVEKTRQFYDRWLTNHVRKIDIDSLAAWGFNSVRLPMHYNLFTFPTEDEPVAGRQTWLDKGFAMTDSLLAWCSQNHIYLILDLHAAPGGQGHDLAISDRDETKPSLWDGEANRQKMIAFWKKLASRYSNEPWLGGYDIMNEPNWGFEHAEDKNGCSEKTNEPLRKLMMAVTSAIREVDKNHIIIIEGNCWGNNYGGVFPCWDNNMVVSFHKYWNNNDEESIRRFLDIREKYNVPVWLGESGENSNVWFQQAIALMESHDIGWCWWPLKKIGFNNPLEIQMPAGYQRIVDYWSGKGGRPSADEAHSALMELADNTRLEKCIYHRDVIDAMFRQVGDPSTKSFTGKRIGSAGSIAAVDYDLGRNGKAYYDLDTADYHISSGSDWRAWNKGRTYRNDGVDIEKEPATDDYFVSEMQKGEWLQYTFYMKEPGTYSLSFLISSKTNDGKISAVSGPSHCTVDVLHAGDQKWNETEGCQLSLDRGLQVLKVFAENGTFRLKSIQFHSLQK